MFLNIILFQLGPDPPCLKSLRPEFLRLAPPLFLREDEMIWQDPVDLSHITYEYEYWPLIGRILVSDWSILAACRYDHSLLETEEEGCEARRLTQVRYWSILVT